MVVLAVKILAPTQFTSEISKNLDDIKDLLKLNE
jgi:hypothetical protein